MNIFKFLKKKENIIQNDIESIEPTSLPEGEVKVLIVDDAYINRYILIRYLEKITKNIITEQCDNGEKALLMVNEKNYDLIFLDIKMPRMNGDEVCIKLKKDKYKAIIIGITGQIEIISYLYSIGMSYCLEKPLTIDSLRKCLKRFIPDNVLPIDYIATNTPPP